MAGNFEYYAEMGLNAGAAISELSRVSSTAETTTKNLDALHTALETVAKHKGPKGAQAQQLQTTLGLYQQLATAVASYGRSLKTINSTDLNNGVRKTATSLDHMKKALEGVDKTSKEDFDAKKRTLDLYKQMAAASKTQADTLRSEADAIKAVAQAERTRQQTAASAANAANRGGGSTDMWGVTADEREQRKKAQVVVQAEREMEAAFEARAREHLKANGQLDRQQAAMHEAAAATKAHTDATAKNAVSQQDQERALASTRYALYEVAAAYTAVSAAALALPVASARTAIEMEAQFAHVARTTGTVGAPLENLRQQFIQMSTEIPVTFEELSKIGTLGAQMGIASADLESFADTVAKFAATTNVTVDQAAMSFGRLANMMHLTEADYVHLGSAISELGTASVATESEILTIAESIATTANMAGFSAAEVSGLSTAMASLRIRPEMARGAMQRVFAKINRAAAEGGESLAAFAQQVGMTNEQFLDMWTNDPSALFMRLTKSIEGLDKVTATATMGELGFTNIRDVELLNRLANGYEVYADSMLLAQDAYARGDYLETETGPIFETAAAALERLANAFKGMLDSFGQSSLKPITLLAELLIKILNYFRDMSPVAKNFVTAIGLVVGVFTALRASMALSMASMYAYRLMMRNMGAEGGVSFANLRRQASLTFPGLTGMLNNATAAMGRFSIQMGSAQGAMAKTAVAARGLGSALGMLGPVGWIGLIGSAVAGVYALANAHETAAEQAKAHAQTFIENMGGIESLMAALRNDAAEFASGEQTEVLGHLNVQVRESKDVSEDAASALTDVLVPAHEDQAEAVRDVTAAYQEGIGAIGEHTDQWMRQGFAEAIGKQLDPEQIQRLMEAGFDFEELMRRWQSEGKSGAEAYINDFVAEFRKRGSIDEMIIDYLPDALLNEDAANETGRIVREAVGVMLNELVDLNAGLEDINSTHMLQEALGIEPLDDFSEGVEKATDKVEALNDEVTSLIDTMFRLVDTEAAVFVAMENLGTALDENGTDFNTWTEEGRANLDAFRGAVDAIWEDIVAQMEQGVISADEATALFAAEYEQLLAQLAASGVDTSQFDYFYEYIETLFDQPVAVNVDVDPAFQALDDLYTHAMRVLSDIAANSSGVWGGVASWGAKAAQNVRTRHRSTTSTSRPRPRPNLSSGRETQLQAIEAARARAEQERLAKATENAAKGTERQAKEQKRAADEARKLREEIAEAKDEGRIFEEIIKGLGEAFKDTLYQFNNFQSNRDSVESHLISMRDAAQQSAEQVRSLREEYRKLQQEAREDRVEARQAESFAAVARRYGDTERVVDYTTQAKGARESAREKERLAREALKEATALDKNRLALTGYSEQAIKNRGDVRALQERMADLIIAYAETGATTEEVTRYTEDLRRKFIDQLTQMGYNRRDVVRLSDVFKDLKRDIDRVPRQVRIEARARVKEAEAALRNVARGRTATIDIKPKQNRMEITGSLKVRDIEVAREVKTPRISGGGGGAPYAMFAGGGQIPGRTSSPTRDNVIVTGHSFDGVVTAQSGEFIIRKPAVDAIGLNTLHALNSMSPGAVAMSSAPAVNAGRTAIQLVEILPHQIHQIASAVSTVLAVDGKVLAGTTNAQNTNAARRGVK